MANMKRIGKSLSEGGLSRDEIIKRAARLLSDGRITLDEFAELIGLNDIKSDDAQLTQPVSPEPIVPFVWPNSLPSPWRMTYHEVDDWDLRCGCNPRNGGSGICMCVRPSSGIMC